MTDKEFQSLIDDVKQQIANAISAEEALTGFVRAGIFNPDGTFTEQYQILTSRGC